MRRTAALLLVAGIATLATGCGGSSGGSPAATDTAAPASGSSSPQPAITAPADVAAAKAEITANWAKFFRSDTPRAASIRLLQKGSTLGPALQKAEQEDQATGGQRSATVTKVVFTSPTQANVTYKLVAAGRTLNASGVAVLEDGTWKVSDVTFCTLVVLGNGERPVKGCAT